jgi:hypothetical protein
MAVTIVLGRIIPGLVLGLVLGLFMLNTVMLNPAMLLHTMLIADAQIDVVLDCGILNAGFFRIRSRGPGASGAVCGGSATTRSIGVSACGAALPRLGDSANGRASASAGVTRFTTAGDGSAALPSGAANV